METSRLLAEEKAYFKGRSDERTALLAEIREYKKDKSTFVEQRIDDLLSFLSSLKEKKPN